MDIATAFRIVGVSNNIYYFPKVLSLQTHTLSSPIRSYPFRQIPATPFVVHSRRRNSGAEPVLKPSIVDEVLSDDEDDDDDDLLFDEFHDEGSQEDNNFFEDEDEDSVEDAELCVGDGEGGGGISLARLPWDKEALAIAKEVALSFEGEVKIYAFRTLPNYTIRVRIERLTNKSGSPTMADLEAFHLAYRKRLDDAELSGSIPNICLEVSSPGVERVVRVPEELDRFKERPLYVRYVSEVAETGSSTEKYGVFKLVSFDMESSCCTWELADVKVNRVNGRPLSKKQREWRLNTPFDSLRLVRFHPIC